MEETREDERRIAGAISAAFSALASNGAPPEWKLALEQLLVALDVEDVLPPEHQTSLPSFWAVLFRPLANGAHGVDSSRRSTARFGS